MAWAWRKKSMQKIVIIRRSSSLYLAKIMGDWTSRIAWCEAPYLKEFPRASKLLYPAERGGPFLQEWDSHAIAVEQSNWASSNGLADLLGLEKLEL